MRKIQTVLLAGALALAGTAAFAASSDVHHMKVRLADGSVANIEYTGDIAPKVSLAPRSVIEHQMLHATDYLDKKVLTEVVEQNFPNPRALDEWVPHTDHQGRRSFIRAYAPRLIHVLPGNSPGMGVRSIAQSALVKSVSLFKMPSADPFSTVAFLAAPEAAYISGAVLPVDGALLAGMNVMMSDFVTE